MVVPPVAIKPITVIGPMVPPVVVDLDEIVFSPVVPAIAIVDAVGTIVGPVLPIVSVPALTAAILSWSRRPRIIAGTERSISIRPQSFTTASLTGPRCGALNSASVLARAGCGPLNSTSVLTRARCWTLDTAAVLTGPCCWPLSSAATLARSRAGLQLLTAAALAGTRIGRKISGARSATARILLQEISSRAACDRATC